MLESVDRIQLVVADLDRAASAFERILGAEVALPDDVVAALGARRRSVRVGTSWVELLLPDGQGPVSDFAANWTQGLFGAGFAVRDVDAMAGQLASRGCKFTEEGEQLFLGAEATGGHGMPVVISKAGDADVEPVGLVTHLYEVTNIVGDSEGVAAEYAELFGLDSGRFQPIASEQYGYEGVLALFEPDKRLDRIEVVSTTDPAKTMGRFGARRGESLYMCYMESDSTVEIRKRLLADCPDDWTGSRTDDLPDGLFIHPNALSGLLLGVSRTTVGWLWSGRPDRVEGQT